MVKAKKNVRNSPLPYKDCPSGVQTEIPGEMDVPTNAPKRVRLGRVADRGHWLGLGLGFMHVHALRWDDAGIYFLRTHDQIVYSSKLATLEDMV
jgi:hypothetical protein